MICWQIAEQGFVFQITIESAFLPLSRWDTPFHNPDYAQSLLLLELLENEQAQEWGDGLIVPFIEIAKLDTTEQSLLGLPPRYPFEIQIDSQGIPTDTDFQIKGRYYTFSHGGKQLFFERQGCLITSKEEQYLLSQEQHELLNYLAQFSQRTEHTIFIHYQAIQKIKALAKDASAVLERFLSEEEVLIPSEFELMLKMNSDNSLTPLPQYNDPKTLNLPEKFDKFRQSKSMYSFEDTHGRRTRLLISPELQAEMQKFKTVKQLVGAEKDEFLAHPETYFDPDLINLDNFSQRVLELGLYQPQFQVFISCHKSQWIPGILVNKGGGNQSKIQFPDLEKLQSFEKAIVTALSQHDPDIKWETHVIPVKIAQELYSFAHRQLASKTALKDNNGKKVLIIKENLESLEHQDLHDKILSTRNYLSGFKPPRLLSPEFSLMEHQKEGIGWLQTLYSEGFSGALLADDMGLGKTLQVLAFILWVMDNKNPQNRPCLIVAPVTLLENWEQEYQRFFPKSLYSVYRAYGDTIQGLNGSKLSPQLASTAQIVLTTYETLRKKQLGFCAVDWQVVILDEAQRIKTPGTLTTNAAKALKADFKIAATGTPVENTLLDMWCIMDFAVPGLLNSAQEFKSKYHEPLFIPDTSIKKLGCDLQNEVDFHLLRRLKSDILQSLPSKNHKIYSQNMPLIQFNAYQAVLLEVLQYKNTEFYPTKMLQALHYLKTVSDHPYLLDRQLNHISMPKLICSSAKLQSTVEILEQVQAKKEKVILFAERRKTQHLLRRLLGEQFKLSTSIINGETPASTGVNQLSRQQLIDQFQAQTGFQVIIMSPLAAGVGLNVTGANHVIHYSRHWNPAKEAQATDRVYRIGQKRDVFVHIPMAITEQFKTFDVVLNELLERKRLLAEAVLIPQNKTDINLHDMAEQLVAKVTNLADSNAEKESVTLELLDSLELWAFKKACALLWQAMNFKTTLTEASKSKGVDMLAWMDTEHWLLGIRPSHKEIGVDVLSDLIHGCGYYHQQNEGHYLLGIVTNAALNSDSQQYAKSNHITIFDRSILVKFLLRTPITWEVGAYFNDEQSAFTN